jgi:osmotically-inducible protein OsmY
MTMNCDSSAINVAEVARDRLRKSSSVVVRTVSCDYEQGVLVLRGRVPSEYCKQLVLDAIARLPGVAQVADEIEVATSLG